MKQKAATIDVAAFFSDPAAKPASVLSRLLREQKLRPKDRHAQAVWSRATERKSCFVVPSLCSTVRQRG
jgi:hypothetical protein